MATKVDLGKRHRMVRETILRMSVQDYAAEMGVKVPTVYSWESGRTAVPQAVLAALETRWGVAASWMLTGSGQPTLSTSAEPPALLAERADAITPWQHLERQVQAIRAMISELHTQSPHVVAPARPGMGGYRIPMLALGVSAGLPTAADDTVEREIDLAEMLLEHPESTYFIRVVGDSMTDAGISDGDTLIVDCSVQPRAGQVVIAKVYGELTVKRYLLQESRPILRAENRRYKDIVITADMDFSIVGVVRSCIKKF